ncbi:hypothetical protein FQ007_26340, partial [Escherichia coli]|nr:hypothetical protein [Escherichia coli]
MAIIPTTSPVAAPAAPARALFPCARDRAAFTTAWAATFAALFTSSVTGSVVMVFTTSARYGAAPPARAALRLPPASPCTAAVAACIA